ncbi:MAG TPA: DUF6515 family protein [Candidatus Omnitrophota bacterium]|nr:DUF6515 family protein [Candidatus Omnitrophota bacterium]
MNALSRKQGLVYGLITGVLILSTSTDAFARPPEHGHERSRFREPHFHGPSHRPFYYPRLPRGYLPIHIAGLTYYYSEGLYYQSTQSGYVIVSAPRGAVIRSLPSRHKVIVHDDTDYYYYNNTYYIQEPAGYSVVSPPAQVVASNPQASEAPEKSVVINVPNANGSYMPITLQKYSDGYTGPNGEFYPDYPTVEQLKAMYSKSSSEAGAPEKEEEFEYNIPNKNGSFTKVKILKSSEGFVGPEGEFYPSKPTLAQLKVMYAKD